MFPVIGDLFAPSPTTWPANLLQFRGWAVAKQMTDHEGSGNFDFHVELHNPDPSEGVTITRAEWYHASPGGWITNGPWPMVPRQANDDLLPASTVPPASDISFERINWWSFRLSQMIFLFHAERTGYYQYLLGQLPIIFTPATNRSNFPAELRPSVPRSMPNIQPLAAPVFLALIEEVTQFPVDGGAETWIPVTGQVINGTGGAIGIMQLSWKLESDDQKVITGNFPLRFYAYDRADKWDDGAWYDMSAGPSAKKVFAFNHAIIPSTNAVWTKLTIYCSYQSNAIKPGGTGNSADSVDRYFYGFGSGRFLMGRTVPVSNLRYATSLMAPVGPVSDGNLLWICGNGPQRDDFNAHNGSPSGHYAYDLVLGDARGTMRPGASENSNDSFYAFRKPVRAMAAGKVVAIADSFPDHQGKTKVASSGNNGLVIQHAPNFYAAYAHTRQNSISETGIKVGQAVAAGQKIAEIGNAGGSSEPHLHITLCKFGDLTGVPQAVPMQWKNIRYANGQSFNGVPTTDMKFKVV